jgi:hypothetical protein
MKKIVIAGGTGFIGKYLAGKFKENGYKVLIISRSSGNISWKPVELTEALENAELVINLTGKSINCRHNEMNKKELMDSRTEPTMWIGNAIEACHNPPKLWINASASDYYKPWDDRATTEDDYQTGDKFLSELALQWEKVFFAFQLPATRQVALRTSVVLGKNGGALKPLVLLSKFGLGGKHGSGKQIFSWNHIEDYYRIIKFVADKPEISGAINCTAPYPIDNKHFMKAIRKYLHIPFGIPAPKFAIQLGAIIIGTEASLLLDSSNMIPKRLLDAGFQFTYPKIEEALADILN